MQLIHLPQSLRTCVNACTNADDYCCAKLQAINFQSNLPVIIVDTGNKNVTRAKTKQFEVCTCSTGLTKGDLNDTAIFRVRGGTDSRKPLTSTPCNEAFETIEGI